MVQANKRAPREQRPAERSGAGCGDLDGHGRRGLSDQLGQGVSQRLLTQPVKPVSFSWLNAFPISAGALRLVEEGDNSPSLAALL